MTEMRIRIERSTFHHGGNKRGARARLRCGPCVPQDAGDNTDQHSPEKKALRPRWSADVQGNLRAPQRHIVGSATLHTKGCHSCCLPFPLRCVSSTGYRPEVSPPKKKRAARKLKRSRRMAEHLLLPSVLNREVGGILNPMPREIRKIMPAILATTCSASSAFTCHARCLPFTSRELSEKWRLFQLICRGTRMRASGWKEVCARLVRLWFVPVTLFASCE